MSIHLTINGELHSVNLREFPVDITLNTYIRDYAQLTGTKFMCLEGGCGTCIVVIRGHHPVTREYHGRAANSCLTLLNTCDGSDIITIEGLGDKSKGYHPLQERLAHLSGSQCGYCSPGMVMNMFGLLEANGGSVTSEQVENAFGGNICRCTGYRPILDAFKSFASDSDFEYVDLCQDIEDLTLQNICKKSGKACQKSCNKAKEQFYQYDEGETWYYPGNLQEVFTAINRTGQEDYILVAGNTGHGVYRRKDTIKHFIDVNKVPELHINTIGQRLEIGGNVSLTEAMDIFTQSAKIQGFEYCLKLVDHLDRVANIPVRNMGTIAGNLMLKYYHNEFPSDAFLLLTTVGASICVADSVGHFKILSLPEFLHYPMDRNLILKVMLPPIDRNVSLFDTYKITPRLQNAHAYVNAGFLIQFTNNQISSSNIVFGGINPSFINAKATSNYLVGKNLFAKTSFEQALQILSAELNPDWNLPEASPNYRKLLACCLFYKFILKNMPPAKMNPINTTGGQLLVRPLSSGTQTFDTKKENWPLTQPVMKLEALVQCSGEAVYMNDLPYLPRQLWAAYVHAQKSNCTIARIDPSKALKVPGVEAFFSAKDIPGNNSHVVVGFFAVAQEEEIFCSGAVKFHSQPVGLIVAKTLDLARRAARLVQITYENPRVIKCTMEDVLKRVEKKYSTSNIEFGPSAREVKGHFEMGGQFHFSMETQTTVCIPEEDGLKVYCATHYLDMLQCAMSLALQIPENKLNFKIRRLGGSYGAKLSRAGNVAIACALAATKLNRPIRFVEGLESNMATVGKRMACVCDYTVNVDKKGKIQKFSIQFFEDFGYTMNDNPIPQFTTPFLSNCYTNNGWDIKGEAVLTDAPSHTWCRSPGSLEGIAMIENIMEHIARDVNRDPVDVRMENIPADSKMRTLLPKFVDSTSYRSRRQEINNFNKANRWRKRGIAVSIMRFPLEHFGTFPATVVIYHLDGSVAISHGGVEMGQGLNTKAAQVAAYTLGIPLSSISIKPTTSFNGANSFTTGASIGSESVGSAVRGACEELLRRIAPVRKEMKNATWPEIIRKCHERNISLIANHLHRSTDLKSYEIFGLACSEMEVDILTGNFQLKRVDILEDTGESLSPLVDVGQIEGAFTMGVGYWLTEKLVYDRRNGELLTNRTWNYKVPGVKDIPIDFRINLLQNSSNSGGLLRSKATGEPAICLSISTLFALRHAIDSARTDARVQGNWYHLGAPTTPEHVLLNAGHSISQLTL